MNLTDTPIASIEVQRPNLLSHVRNWVADWIDHMCAGNEAPVDPTAHFSLREWADLPPYHAACDD